MSRAIYYTDDSAPCWSCNGTIAEYTTDDTVSLIDIRCLCCWSTDAFRPPPGIIPTTAADVSAAHRATRPK